MHIPADDFIDVEQEARRAREAEQRAIKNARADMVASETKSRRRAGQYVRIKTLGTIVRILRDEVEAEVTSLRREIDTLKVERALAELPDFRQEQPLGQWSPANASWRQ